MPDFWQRIQRQARTIMRSTKDTYEFEATLDAYEGKGDDATRVYSKN